MKNSVSSYNIDELYEYIIADDKETNKIKGKRENKSNNINLCKKKNAKINNPPNFNKNLSNNFNSKILNGNPIIFYKKSEIKVEEFREKIINDSINANSIKKVKPNISIDWIKKLNLNND